MREYESVHVQIVLNRRLQSIECLQRLIAYGGEQLLGLFSIHVPAGVTNLDSDVVSVLSSGMFERLKRGQCGAARTARVLNLLGIPIHHLQNGQWLAVARQQSA